LRQYIEALLVDVLPQPVDTSTSYGFNLASLIIVLMPIGLYATWW